MGRQLERGRHAALNYVSAFALAAFMPFAARAESAMPADLERSLAAYHSATVHKDIAALSDLVTDDYMLVNSDASVQGKASYLADFRTPGFVIEPYAVQHPTYRKLGDAALTGGEMDLSWTQAGVRQHRHLRFVHVWVRQAGHWRIAYSQLTRPPI